MPRAEHDRTHWRPSDVYMKYNPLFHALQVGFETEGTAIFDTMCYVQNEVRLPSVLAHCQVLSAESRIMLGTRIDRSQLPQHASIHIWRVSATHHVQAACCMTVFRLKSRSEA